MTVAWMTAALMKNVLIKQGVFYTRINAHIVPVFFPDYSVPRLRSSLLAGAPPFNHDETRIIQIKREQ
ncbi:hypothetical protein [Pectobacterium atrosepticum]|uniref:hypothetical protein n=1 Tax=Pectobacterium atrosepticum TaxID=29471 RepID=UPI000506535C|nr:hypothetical protein [Pectobacterium atrosepticum]KFX12660.1 hypothetical protein JV34_17270 [Pectobacterium atrosepticum]